MQTPSQPIFRGLLRTPAAILSLLLIIATAALFYATPVSVATQYAQSVSGGAITLYYEDAALAGTAAPTVNTATSQPTGPGGSTTVTKGSTMYLYSPAFASSLSVPAGNWVVDLWASSKIAGKTMTVAIYIVNSAGTVVSTVNGGTSTQPISGAASEVGVTLAGAAVTIPAGDYIRVDFTAPTGGGTSPSFTIYWGNTRPTNFQVTLRAGVG
jgi:hypothetical protein